MRKKAIRKTPRKPARPVRVRKSASRKARSGGVPRPIRSNAVLIAIIALSGTVILAAMGRARGPETDGTDVYLETAAPAEEFVGAPVADAAEPATAKAPAPTPEAKAVVAPVVETEVATEVVAAPPPAVIATTEAPAATTDAAMVSTTTATAATISGCLTFDEGTYRLKDATGTDAPKSRSWKSGFLRKRSATLDVVDAGSLGLPNHVGQRVEVTGTLLDREVQARSLHRLAEACRK